MSAFIAVVDLETTGFVPPAEVIELGGCRLRAGTDLFGEPDWTNALVDHPGARLLRPRGAIPPENSAVHHIVASDVEGKPHWDEIVAGAAEQVSQAVALAAHSASMEKQWLTPEAGFVQPWICTYKCSLRAWPDAPSHSNQGLRYWLNPEGLIRDLSMPPHRAGPDAYVTAHILRELLKLHSLTELLEWSSQPTLLVRVPFGKSPPEGSRGMLWTEIEDGLLRWTLGTDMGEDIIYTAQHEMARRRAAREERRREEGIDDDDRSRYDDSDDSDNH